MASTYWMKLFYEILDDPKVGRLTDHLRWRMVELFLIAGECDQDGILPDIDDIAWRVRSTPEEVSLTLEQLEKVEIVTFGPGGWKVTNFSKRNQRVTPADRMKASRERKHRQEYYGDGGGGDSVTFRNNNVTRPVTFRNNNVTSSQQSRNTDIDIDIDKMRLDKDADADAETKSAAATAENIYKLYDSNVGELTEVIQNNIQDAVAQYGEPAVRYAIREAVTHNARTWAYIIAILTKKQGKRKGEPSGASVEAFRQLRAEMEK
jgi:DnaD/phage-associated family protein